MFTVLLLEPVHLEEDYAITTVFENKRFSSFFGKQTNYFYEFEVCFLRGQVSSNLRKAQGWGKSVLTFDRYRPQSVSFVYY